MLEMVRIIPGPVFLLLYVVLAVLVIVFGKKWMAQDSGAPMPDYTRFDPITIALLKGGWAHVIKTAVFDLLNKGLVSIEGDKRDTSIVQEKLPAAEIEKKLRTVKPPTHLVYRYINSKTRSSELFNSREFRTSLEGSLVVNYQELEQNGLVKSTEEQSRGYKVFWICTMVLMVVGFVKLVLGIVHEKPIIFLVLSMVISMVFLALILMPWERTSDLGRRYLAEMGRRFEWLKTKAQSHAGIPGGIDPAYVVAIFGTAALTGSSVYEGYRAAFHHSMGSSCGGCSMALSATTSGCGGGSGGCGGGCGGCGGCGG